MLIVVSGRCGGVDPFFDIRGMLLGLRSCVFSARINQICVVVALLYEPVALILCCSTTVTTRMLVRL